MRFRFGRLLVAAVFFSSFGVSVVVGCSSFSAADAVNDDAGTADAPALLDQAADADATDVTDAADADITPCAALGGVFCADFENGPLNQGWDGPSVMNSAALSLSDAGAMPTASHALSAVTNVEATLPSDASPPPMLGEAFLSKPIDRGATTKVGLELDVRVDSLASGDSILRVVGLDFGNGQLVSIGVANDTTGFIVIETAADAEDAMSPQFAFPTPAPGAWFHLAIEVDTHLGTVAAAVTVAGTPQTQNFDGFENDGSLGVTVSVGIVAALASAASGVSIDNVIVRLN